MISRIVKNPPRLTNNLELSKWFCEQHNVVNRKLGKDEFDCEKVFERWKMGFSKNPKCADIRL
jgi:FAD-linked sulfhydryl oxidase